MWAGSGGIDFFKLLGDWEEDETTKFGIYFDDFSFGIIHL
jgi:hypothetical protein